MKPLLWNSHGQIPFPSVLIHLLELCFYTVIKNKSVYDIDSHDTPKITETTCSMWSLLTCISSLNFSTSALATLESKVIWKETKTSSAKWLTKPSEGDSIGTGQPIWKHWKKIGKCAGTNGLSFKAYMLLTSIEPSVIHRSKVLEA